MTSSPADKSVPGFKMDDCDLETLSVKPGKLTPAFKRDITEYHVTVTSDVKEITFECFTSDTNACKSISVSRMVINRVVRSVLWFHSQTAFIAVPWSHCPGTTHQFDPRRHSLPTESIPAYNCNIQHRQSILPCYPIQDGSGLAALVTYNIALYM